MPRTYAISVSYTGGIDRDRDKFIRIAAASVGIPDEDGSGCLFMAPYTRDISFSAPDPAAARKLADLCRMIDGVAASVTVRVK